MAYMGGIDNSNFNDGGGKDCRAADDKGGGAEEAP